MEQTKYIDLRELWQEFIKCRKLMLLFVGLPLLISFSYCKFIAKPVYGYEVYMMIPASIDVGKFCAEYMQRDISEYNGIVKAEYRYGIDTAILTFRGKSGEEVVEKADKYLNKTVPILQGIVNGAHQTVARKIVIKRPMSAPEEPLKPKTMVYTVRAGIVGLFAGCLYVICSMLHRKY